MKYIEENVLAYIEKPVNRSNNLIRLQRFNSTSRKITIDFDSSSLFYSQQHKLLVAAGSASVILLCKIDVEDLHDEDKFTVRTEVAIKAFDVLDNGLLVTQSEENVSLWVYEVNSNKLVHQRTLDCPLENDKIAFVQAVDSNKLACGLASSNIFIYNENFVQMYEFKAHERSLSGLKYAFYGEKLITLSRDEKSVKLWDYKNGDCVKEFKFRKEPFPQFLVMLDMRYFGVVCCDVSQKDIEIYDAHEMKRYKTVKSREDLNVHFFNGVEFSNSLCFTFNCNNLSVFKIAS